MSKRKSARAALAGLGWHGLATMLQPGLRLLLARRVKRGKEDPARLDERRGRGTPPPAAWQAAERRVWLHAASVGETVSILPVIAELLARPGVGVLVTTGTLTGAEILARRMPEVTHRFMPHDVPRSIGRFLDAWQPNVAGFVDSEIWPNTLAILRRRGIGAVLVNGRLSARSAQRWGQISRVLGGTPFALLGAVAARDATDAVHVAALGGPVATLVGDLKAAAPPLPVEPDALAALTRALAERPVWLAACTHPGEEIQIAAVHARLAAAYPTLLTLIAPRHPERGGEIAAELGDVARRSLGSRMPEAAGLYLWDTLGELGLLFRAAPVVFIGNSLGGAAQGGHNPYEPARCGAAIATGPDTANFREAVATLQAAGGIVVVANAEALAGWVAAMLADPVARALQAEAAAVVAGREQALPGQVAELLLAQIVAGPR